MGAEKLKTLITRLHPDTSIRELERRAGVPNDKVLHWVKPRTEFTRLPPPETIREIADVLGCEVSEVLNAFNDSLPLPLPLHDLPGDELELLDRYRRLAPRDRENLLAIAQTLGASGPAVDRRAPRRRAGAG